MTHFLVTEDNPDGSKLEDILKMVRADIIRRQVKIIDDESVVAQKIIQNNISILHMLTECISLADDSTKMLDQAYGKAGASPRIGTK